MSTTGRRHAYEVTRQTRELQSKIRPQEGVVSRVRFASLCRYCRRELVAVPKVRVNGRVHVELRCPRHGTLPFGESYMQGYVSE